MMKLGIDLDGVVFDSETTFRTYEEIFDISKGQNKLIDRSEPKFQKRYSWDKEERKEFNDYFLEISKNSPLMAGFKKVYELLKDYDIEFIAITARGIGADGVLSEYMEEDMIDDDYHVIESLANAGIKTLYFRDVNLKKLAETEYIKEVNNWGDIYRIIHDMFDR